MNRWTRRTLQYLLVLFGVMLAYAIVYNFGMQVFEDDPQTFLHSLQVVVETFTTTGFGSDSPWASAEMNVLVIAMDLSGVLLIFMALPVLVFPVMEEILSTTVPTELEEDLADHVVICTYTPRTDALVDELEAWDVDHVILEPDRDTASDLFEADYPVIHEDPESSDGLRGVNVEDARAVVADASDEVDASIVLTAKEVAEDVPVVSVVEEPDSVSYHRLAGADEVLSPRPLLGERLASKVTTAVAMDLGEGVQVGEDLEIAELPIHPGSELVGRTLAESGIRERAGVHVIGTWYQGHFETPPSPDAKLDERTVLLVSGHASQLDELKALTRSEIRQFDREKTIVVGYGHVGQAVSEALAAANVPHSIVDKQDIEGVDVVGDATDRETLREAGLDEARSVILALPDDTITEFTTLVVRDLDPTVEIIARVEEGESTPKVYRAGADYVLSLATVTGRMIGSRVLDEDVLALDSHVEVIRTEAPALVGHTLSEADIPSRTGCTVVGVQRNGEVRTDLGPDFEIQADDELVVAGTDEGTNRFVETFR
ncbi:potassium channel family protein [Halobacteriales archaeon Cl-PHB]